MRRLSTAEDESGFALVLTALSMFTLLLMAGFAVDVGSWYLSASRLQRASDAAALAGAISLPDTAAAQSQAASAFQRNGLTGGTGGVDIVYFPTSDRFTATVTDNDVPTYFLRAVIPHIKITRTSTAVRSTSAPALGSPYNVLGSGNLDIPGIPKQNFWLAVSGPCSPKEDGDYFSALRDGSKGPFTTAVDAHGNYIPEATARHHCVNSAEFPLEENPNYSRAGYSYFVDIPPAPVVGGTVTLRIFSADYQHHNDTDENVSLPAELGWPWLDTRFVIYDTQGTPGDEKDDTILFNQTTVTYHPGLGEWADFYTFPYSDIKDGHQYRVQVATNVITGGLSAGGQRGVNGFSIGAFRSWAPGGCDGRVTPDCPQVYGRDAVSVYNNLSDAAGGTATFYLAEMPTSFIGTPFNLFLWDPGEGVEKMEVLAPDGTPLPFDWSCLPSVAGCGGAGAVALDTSGTGPQPGPNRSNNFKFNDRLVTLKITLPSSYEQMVSKAGGDQWLRIRYTVGTTPTDRTTWGLKLVGGTSAPPKLIRTQKS